MSRIEDFCNLSEEELGARRKQLREELAPQARGREELADGLALFFDATQKMRDQLDDFVAFERECCPGLGFAVQETFGALRLEISGIGPNSSIFAGVGVGTPSEPMQSETRGWLRVVRSAGLGAVGAFVVFCVAPLALVAVLGDQLAAPLGALDNPWVIGAGTIVFGGLMWRCEKRRAAAREKTASAGGCGC